MMRHPLPLALAVLALAAPALAQQTAPQRPAAQAQRPAQTPPAAQSATPAPAAPAEPGRAWTVNCADTPATPPRACQLGTAVMLQPQNQRIAQVIMMRQPESRSLSLMFQMPHGSLLPAGMSWQVDNADAQRLAFQTSGPEGVFVGVPVTDDLLAALRRGTTLRLGFVAAGNRQTVMLPVPLAGFDAGATEFFAMERGDAPQPRR